MKKTRILAALLAIAVIILLALILLPQEEPVRSAETPMELTESVVVAAVPIAAYETITPEMLTTRDYPAGLVPEGSFASMDELADATALTDLSAQEMILANHVMTSPEQATKLALKVPEGYRAASVAVDDVSGVCNQIRAGDHVDVIVTTMDIDQNTLDALAAPGQSEASAEDEETENADGEHEIVSSARYVAVPLLQNIEVLSLDQAMADAPLAVDGQNRFYATVTLSVLPEDTLRLAWAFSEGQVYLALRGEGDGEIVEIQPYYLWDTFGIDAPAEGDDEP